jgi:Fe-Mn family superoxide dismutase
MNEIYTLPDLPYDYGALEPHLDARIVELHHDRHHAAYVKGANAALERLADAGTEGAAAVAAERDLAFHLGGHLLHSVLWTNLSGEQGEPGPELAEVLGDTFGDLGRFRARRPATALGLQGSGWAIAAWEPTGRRVVVQQVHDHQAQHAPSLVPLLVIDGWEHAYYLQYQNEKARYFDAIWNVVNWTDVERRLHEARAPERVDA